MKRALLATVTLATLAFATHKHADAGYLNLGGSFTVNETNAPLTGSFPAVATLFPQTTGGLAVQLNEIILGGGTEWITWTFRSLTGSIAGNVNANWSLQAIGNTVNSHPTLAHFFLAWGNDTTGFFTPISDVGVNLPIEVNPITGSGLVFGAPLDLPNRTTTGGTGNANTLAALMINNYGADPNTANEFFMAEEFVTGVPEPASLALLGFGVLGLGLTTFRRRRA